MSEQSAAIFNLENLIRDCKHYLKESGHLQKDKIITWAESLEKLGKTPTHLICSQMRDEARREFGWTRGQLEYIGEVLSGKEYDKFKDHKNDNVTERHDNMALEILNNLKRLREKEILDTIDKDMMQSIHEEIEAAENDVESYGTKKGWVWVNNSLDDDDEVVTTETVPSGQSEVYYATRELREDYEEGAKYLKGLEEKEYDNPPTADKKEQDKEAAVKIRSLSILLRPLNKLYRSCKDEKYSFSLWQHADMQVKEEIYSKHGAAVKSKIEIVRNGLKTGEFRKMTRERVGDSKEEVKKWMDDMTGAMRSFACWMGFIEWRDNLTDLNGRIAARKRDLEDKFSEKAIG